MLWKPPWTREGSKLTLLFESHIMRLAKIAELINEHDTRLWRIIKHYTSVAYAMKDLSKVVKVGCDETSSRKAHSYVTVCADMQTRDVIYVTKGKNAKTIERFAAELGNHTALMLAN